MKTIYRYELNPSESVTDIKMPTGAKILTVGITYSFSDGDNHLGYRVATRIMHENISVWALVDTDNTPETRRFLTYGTGADMDETNGYDIAYIGSVTKKNNYKFHIFEVLDIK